MAAAPVARPIGLPERVVALDVYRGFVMLLMMAEVLQLSRVARAFPDSGFWHALAYHQTHVPWAGCSLHDTIQPGFSFLVGAALPFSLAARVAKGLSFGRMFGRALWRSFALIALGIFLRSIGGPRTNFTFEDTLTQIGLGYPFLFLLGFRSARAQWTALAVTLGGYWLAWALWPSAGPGFDYQAVGVPADWPHHDTGLAAHWNKNANLGAAFDQWFLNLFPRSSPFVANGGGYLTLSFIPTLGTMILGLAAGRWLREAAPRMPLARLMIAGGAGVVAGLLLHFTGICPVVKRVWTPSWTLFSGGLCFLFLAAFCWIVETKGYRRWAFPLIVIGMNSIAAYVIAHLWEAFLISSFRTHLGPGAFEVFGTGVLAPSGATVEHYRAQGYNYPPEYGPLAAVTPGTPGGLMTMLAEFGTMSLAQVLAPAIQLADGYPIEAQTANSIETNKSWIKQWKYSPAVFLPHAGDSREAPDAGEIFRQPDLAATLRKLVDAEAQALKSGKSRKDAILAAYDRFYKGDIAEELVRGFREQGGLFTASDLATWKVKIEEPLSTNYKGIEVYKLREWQQGPVMLQALNILETMDVKSLGYNTPKYMHALYQTMNLAYADRDFYYGDPDFPPDEPIRGLLSKEYAQARAKTINRVRNDPGVKPGDPYPFQQGTNPFANLLQAWPPKPKTVRIEPPAAGGRSWDDGFYAGTTSIQAADASGWVISVTPSGAWIPSVIAGRTGIGVSQRAQSFVLDPAENPYNVLAPGKRPRVTLTPTLAMKDGLPWMAFSVQGGDSQDQNLLQCFLNMVEFGMTPQQAVEAPNINSFQMMNSFNDHTAQRGRMLVASSTSAATRAALQRMGYTLEFAERTSGPITAIWFDRKHGTMWGAVSNHGEDYGIAW